jgi:hypothetical protein
MTALHVCFPFPRSRLLYEEAIAILRGLAPSLEEGKNISVFNATGRVSEVQKIRDGDMVASIALSNFGIF